MKTIEELIEKYPKIFEDYEGNPGRVNWSCPTGWLDLVDMGCGIMQNRIDSRLEQSKKPGMEFLEPFQLTCMQIKEKFGGLRFYTNGVDEYSDGVIRMMEHLSYETCEECGSNQNVGYTKGWITTICEPCAKREIGDDYLDRWKSKTTLAEEKKQLEEQTKVQIDEKTKDKD